MQATLTRQILAFREIYFRSRKVTISLWKLNEIYPDNHDFFGALLKADRWGNQWSKSGVLLRFGAGSIGTAISLDPVAAKHLSLGLMNAVHQHEASFGISWSEHDDQRSAIAEARLHGSALKTSNSFAHALYLLIKNLPLNGYERSFKMAEDTLWSERFLVGISVHAIAVEDVDFLMMKMDVPDVYQTQIRIQLPNTSFIHIGFEQGNINTYKFYLEFLPGNIDANTPHPLYLGYKWNAENAAQRAISSYTQPRRLSLPQLLEKVSAMYGSEPKNAAVCNIAKAIITHAARKVSTTELLFVEVQEENTPRLSFDINLYETGITVSDLQPLLLKLCEHYAIGKKEFDTLLTRTGKDLAGHLSGGTDRNGNTFLTTYHARVTTGGTIDAHSV
ncbi:hypothetical protein [Herminiimonas aquatilis]|uniref:Uncharacterized protein n=1 Tax=Herminiimonas aquatilis TaxID=345342 RepID=A0ABW2J1B2_9BURK